MFKKGRKSNIPSEVSSPKHSPVELNTIKGTLSFAKNDDPAKVGFSNVFHRELYPVVVFYCPTPGECVKITELKVISVNSQNTHMG